MSRIIITVIIITVIFSVMVMGYGFMSRSNQQFMKYYEKARICIEKSEFENADKNITIIIKNLKKDRKMLMMIADHDIVESLNTKLNKALSYIKSNKKALAAAELTEARDIMTAIHGSQQLSLENVL